jgi:hypothetical protein
MARASGGLTRRINLIADKALLAAFAESTHNVTLAHVKAAVRDSEFSEVPTQKPRSPLLYVLGGVAAGGLIGAAGVGAYLALSGPSPAVPEAAPAALQQPVAEPAPPAATASAPPASPAPGAAPIVAVNAPAPAPAASEDLLEQRLLATDAWLSQQEGSAITIQLLGSNDATLLREYFKTIAKYLEIEKVYVYRTVANQRPSFTVLYGTFADRRAVVEVLENLPADMKANRPYTRTIQGIRAEIAHQRS